MIARGDRHGAVQLSSVRDELRSFHETSTVLPVIKFLATACLYLGAMLIALSTLPVLARGVAAVIVGFASARLFLIGHDAAHGSYVPGARLNGVIGRIALLASLHAFSLWRSGHNEHHRYTNLRGRDFVWVPLSKFEYDSLTAFGRVRQRFYRNELGLGLGFHYLIEIWLPRMVFPRHGLLRRLQAVHWLDAGLVAGFVLGLGGIVVWFAALGGRVGDPAHWLFTAAFALVIPLLIVQWFIGFVIFFNHTHPNILWFSDEKEWSYWRVQIECVAHQQFVFPNHLLLPDTIMNHTAHHVDPGIPIRRLRGAQARLEELFHGRIVRYRWSWQEYRRIFRCCKLYDFESQRWLNFAGKSTDETLGLT